MASHNITTLQFVLCLLMALHGTEGLLRSTAATASRKLIEGGQKASAKRFPYYTLIQTTNSFEEIESCGGSLIAPDAVLTAAQCVEKSMWDFGPIVNVDVWVNSSTRFYSGYEYYRKGIRWEIHPKFNASESLSSHDIALIFLNAPVVGVDLLKVNEDDRIPDDTSRPPLKIIGLGEDNNGELPDYLMQATINAVSKHQCTKDWFSDLITGSKLCAGGDGLKGICFADAGGPVIMQGTSAKQDQQVGIASWVYGMSKFNGKCAHNRTADVFTRTSHYANWIDKTLCKYSQATPLQCK